MIKYGEFVSDKQLAQLLGVSVDMIRSQRRQKKGLSFYRFGGRTIRYSLKDVERFLEQNKIERPWRIL